MNRTGPWVVLALVVLASCYPIPESRSGGRRGDAVSGEGVTKWDIFSIDVHVSDAGEVTGYFRTRSTTEHTSFVIEGPVTCLNVVGNRATIGGVLERLGGDEFPSPRLYRGWYLYVEDNVGRGVPDRVGHQWLSEDPVTTCRTPGLPTSWSLEIIEGDVTVIEGPR